MELHNHQKSARRLPEKRRRGRRVHGPRFTDGLIMKHPNKYLWWGLTACGVIAFSILFFFLIFQADRVAGALAKLMSILRPIIYGVVMAYLLTPVYNRFSRGFAGFLRRWDRHGRLSRPASLAKGAAICVTMLLAALAVGGLLAMVAPQVAVSIKGIVDSLPRNAENLALWIENLLADNPQWEETALGIYDKAVAFVSGWVETDLMPSVEKLVGQVSSGIIGTLSFFMDMIIGIIVTVYVLAGKETFAAQGKKIIYACLGAAKGNLALDNLRFVHKVFGGFIIGKLLDSLIIGIICFVGMSLLNMPYVMLISVIVGVTNIIPFFGPFIGAIPSALILLLADPLKCLYFIIFVFLLQQFDGNILGPKILGDSTGLSSFWVLFAILLFGGVMGFVGMIVGVPTFAVAYALAASLTGRALEKRGLSRSTWDYRGLRHIDEATGEYVRDTREGDA